LQRSYAAFFRKVGHVTFHLRICDLSWDDLCGSESTTFAAGLNLTQQMHILSQLTGQPHWWMLFCVFIVVVLRFAGDGYNSHHRGCNLKFEKPKSIVTLIYSKLEGCIAHHLCSSGFFHQRRKHVVD